MWALAGRARVGRTRTADAEAAHGLQRSVPGAAQGQERPPASGHGDLGKSTSPGREIRSQTAVGAAAEQPEVGEEDTHFPRFYIKTEGVAGGRERWHASSFPRSCGRRQAVQEGLEHMSLETGGAGWGPPAQGPGPQHPPSACECGFSLERSRAAPQRRKNAEDAERRPGEWEPRLLPRMPVLEGSGTGPGRALGKPRNSSNSGWRPTWVHSHVSTRESVDVCPGRLGERPTFWFFSSLQGVPFVLCILMYNLIR